MREQHKSKAADTPATVVAALLSDGRDEYQKAFRRSQKRQSKKRIHWLRISLRRLIAIIELDSNFIGSERANKITAKLERQLGRLGKLRDAQVESGQLERLVQIHPEIEPFAKYLRKRKRSLRKKISSRLTREEAVRLGRTNRKLLKQFKALGEQNGFAHALVSECLRKALTDAFDEVQRRRSSVVKGGAKSIHRLRVAFKKYRYMIEVLQPEFLQLSEQQMNELRALQTIMGELQDREVLLRDLEEWSSANKRRRQSIRSLKRELTDQREQSIAELKTKIQSSRWLSLPVVRAPVTAQQQAHPVRV